jgi:hypothetical protein
MPLKLEDVFTGKGMRRREIKQDAAIQNLAGST